MKTGIARAMVALIMPVCVFATTLRLSTDIDLLVLDGKKSPAPCCGVQTVSSWITARTVVFRVEKTIRLADNEQQVYISPPLVVSFNTQRISQVNFRLPRLETEKESLAFDASPRIELVDGDSMPIPVKLDILALTKRPKGTDYEADTETYNRASRRASLPQFATMMADDSTLLSGVSELDVLPLSRRPLLSNASSSGSRMPIRTRAPVFCNGRSNNLRRKPHFSSFLLQHQPVPVIV